MSPGPTESTAEERELLETAREGSEDAYRRLVEPHRSELHAHCYRMLGSVQDAEDALQEALVRAWRGLPKFEGRSSLRSWLYRIATNTSLDAIERRPKRVLLIDYGPPADPHGGVGEPVVESVWIEPYPDETLGIEDGYASPDARYEQRESVELAFIAALQLLPANQRAVLILREVLGFSAQETGDALDTSVASVNSALQRARAAIEKKRQSRASRRRLAHSGTSGSGRSSSDTPMRGSETTSTPSSRSSPRTRRSRRPRWPAGSRATTVSAASSLTTRCSRTGAGGRSERRPTASRRSPSTAGIRSRMRTSPSRSTSSLSRARRPRRWTRTILRASMDPDPDVQARTPEQPADYEKLAAAYARFGLPARLG